MQPKHRTPLSAPNTGLVGSLSARTIFRMVNLLVVKSTVSDVKHRAKSAEGGCSYKSVEETIECTSPMELKQGACVGESAMLLVGRDVCGCRVV